MRQSDYQFQADIEVELARRGVSPYQCHEIVDRASKEATAAIAIILGGAAIAAAARSSGGGGYPYAPTNQDYDWAWDQFFDQYSQLVWACRGRQTGQFAYLDKCTYKAKHDFTWPSKQADAR